MLTLAGFALAFIIPIALLLLALSGSSMGKSSISQAKIAATSIANEAGEIYLQGHGARETIVVNYPGGVKNCTVQGGLVVLSLDIDGHRQDVVAQTFANISGNLSGSRPSGLQSIRLKYNDVGDFVEIGYD